MQPAGQLSVAALERIADGYVKALERREPGITKEVLAGLRRDADFVACVPLRAPPVDSDFAASINAAADWLSARDRRRKKKVG